jgi:hypothetical protein
MRAANRFAVCLAVATWVGCQSSNDLTEGGGGVVQAGACDTGFAEDIEPILRTRCVSCHTGSSAAQGVDLSDAASARTYAPQVADSVQNARMPPAGTAAPLSADERAAIARWAAEGAPSARGSCTVSADACGADAVLPTPDARRLTTEEYQNTLRDLFDDALVAAIGSTIALLPVDTAQKDQFDRDVSRSRFTASEIDAYAAVAEAIADYIVSSPPRVGQYLDPCFAVPSPDVAGCVTPFLRKFGTRLYRAPIADADVNDLTALFSGQANRDDGLRVLVSAMLQSPRFLLLSEIDGSPIDPGDPSKGVALSGPERASRLSYLLWGTMPDVSLTDAATGGTLQTPEGLAAASARMIGDPRTRSHAEHYFRQVLGLAFLTSLGQSSAFVGSIDTTRLRDAGTREILDFALYHSVDTEGTLHDLFTSRRAYFDPADPGSAALASIYGVTPTAKGWMDLPAAERSGILTRVALNLGSENDAHPILRGVGVRRSFLCDKPKPPSADQVDPALIHPPPADPNSTTRQLWTQATASPMCAGCHQWLNPIGFALGGIDTLGRYQTTERRYDAQGAFVRELPLDTRVVPNLVRLDEPQVSGHVELSDRFADLPEARECYVKQETHFVLGREVTTAADQCFTKNVGARLGNASLRDVLRAFVTPASFVKQVVR